MTENLRACLCDPNSISVRLFCYICNACLCVGAGICMFPSEYASVFNVYISLSVLYGNMSISNFNGPSRPSSLEGPLPWFAFWIPRAALRTSVGSGSKGSWPSIFFCLQGPRRKVLALFKEIWSLTRRQLAAGPKRFLSMSCGFLWGGHDGVRNSTRAVSNVFSG